MQSPGHNHDIQHMCVHPAPVTLDQCFCWWPSCREKVRQLELPAALSSKGNPAFSTPSLRPQLTAPSSTQACTTTRPATAAAAEEVQLQLNQDFVAATVKLDNANRRLEVLEREKERLNRSLEEAQVTSNTYLSYYALTKQPAIRYRARCYQRHPASPPLCIYVGLCLQPKADAAV